jgi:hypothetical protein
MVKPNKSHYEGNGSVAEARKREQEAKDAKAREIRAKVDESLAAQKRENEWEEILVPVMVDVRHSDAAAEFSEGVYLGARVVESAFGEVAIHYFMGKEQPFGLWGSMALDSGMRHAMIGRETRITPMGFLELDGGKRMKKVRVQQRGPILRLGGSALPSLNAIANVPLLGDGVDPNTGEVIDAAGQHGL